MSYSQGERVRSKGQIGPIAKGTKGVVARDSQPGDMSVLVQFQGQPGPVDAPVSTIELDTSPVTDPRLVAEFVLDAEGKPRFSETGDARHYQIMLKLLGAPTEVQSVTYKLHESYWDPLREVFRDKRPDFSEPITSFGDYRVVASVSGSKQAGLRVEGRLADLLADSVPPAADKAAVEKALKDLKGK